ncbi:uncharacterized protein PpBr36_05696 [Pyricularia pennisetigena]|uniref:uncharacterized protein n=1 Tax=Pyricularia pennisetigena TaxID=1578925 RepID=UPI00114D4FCD|nr:uncharacterized protein PpBr36_05696 [Pyricularia pennisetigena]TLS23129.1 hypothetical protein PpBr36_05696 [Pyricularia pennisetigena]
MASSVTTPGSGQGGLPAHHFDRAGSLQRMLELETQFKLARLGIGRAESTPDLRTQNQDLTSEPDLRTLRDRRRDLGPPPPEGEANNAMLNSIRRRSVTGPPLSIDIVPSARVNSKSRSKTVSFAAPDEDDDSDRSSICQSPGWGDLGFSRKKKKKEKEKSPTTPKPAEDKKTKRRSRLSKLAPRRAAAQPTSPVPPLPTVPKAPTSAAGDSQTHSTKPANTQPSSILKTPEMLIKSTPLNSISNENYTTSTKSSMMAATAQQQQQQQQSQPQPPVTVAPVPFDQDRGFVGGIRLERETEAASQVLSHSRVRSRSGSLSLFPNARPVINPPQRVPMQRSQSSGPGIDGHQHNVNPVAQIPRSVTLTDIPSMKNQRVTAENKQTPSPVISQTHTGHPPSQSLLYSTTARTANFFKARQEKSERELATPDSSSFSQLGNDSVAGIGAHQAAQNFEFPKTAHNTGDFKPQLRKQPPLYAMPNNTFSPLQGDLRWQKQSPISGPAGSISTFANTDHRSMYAQSTSQDAQQDASGLNKGLSPAPRHAYAQSYHSGSSSAVDDQSPPNIKTVYLSHRGTSESPPHSGTARSFKEKAMAMLRSPTAESPPVITGPFNPRGSGLSFHEASPEPEISTSVEQLVAAPSQRAGQTSGGSSTSSFDDSYMTSLNTTPDSSRPQSAKETPAIVSEMTNVPGRGKIVANDSRTQRHSHQASLVVMKQPSLRSRLKRSSSTYSQIDSPFHLEASAKYEFSNGKPVLSTPVPSQKGESFVIDFSELVATGDKVEGTESLAKTNSRDEQPDSRVWHNVASSIDSVDSEPSDLSRATSQEESDGSSTAVDVSFLPPLKHEPFIPPKSRARKSRMLRSTESTDDDESTAPRIAIAVEHPQLATGAAYLREARKSVLMPPSLISMPQSKPPKIPARLSLAPPISMVVPKAPKTPKPILANSSANRLSAQPVIIPPALPTPDKATAPAGVTVSRRSLLPPPSPSSTANAVAIKKAAPPPELLGQKVAKMLVECCSCRFLHDMPSRLYECMVSPDAVVEDHAMGISGAITTMVKCPWCAHNMSTSCCAGYAAVIHLTERMH